MSRDGIENDYEAAERGEEKKEFLYPLTGEERQEWRRENEEANRFYGLKEPKSPNPPLSRWHVGYRWEGDEETGLTTGYEYEGYIWQPGPTFGFNPLDVTTIPIQNRELAEEIAAALNACLGVAREELVPGALAQALSNLARVREETGKLVKLKKVANQLLLELDLKKRTTYLPYLESRAIGKLRALTKELSPGPVRRKSGKDSLKTESLTKKDPNR